MQLFGIGSLEFLLIIVIAVIVLGPKGMVNAARDAGKLIRKIVHSPIWRDVVDTSREIREFPEKIAREAGIEQDLEDLRRSTQGTLSDLNLSHLPDISTIDQVKKHPEKTPQAKKTEDPK